MYKGKFSTSTAAAKKKRVKKKPSRGTIIFYSIYAAFVVLALGTIIALTFPLNNWLETYQASQPENKSQEIFTQLFADPDWGTLYELANVQDTTYEGSNAYRAYMEEKVGSDPLTCMETSAGLSGDRKYVIRHGNEKIATFTMTGTENESTKITTWELGTVELFFSRDRSITVEKTPEQTVYINGVALDDSHVIKSTATRAEEYLPEGVHGYRREQLRLTGLLVEPTVSVQNADGSETTVAVDENGIFATPIPEMVISDEEQKIAVEAAKAKALYSIRAIGTGELKKHFDSKTQIYKDICNTQVFMQEYTGYRFDKSVTAVSDFYRYSDDLFSAHVTLQLEVTRVRGSIKDYDIATTFFFTRQEDGSYRVTDITNLRLQEQQVQVQLVFMGEEPISAMVDAASHSLQLPQITAPTGQILRGWAKQESDEAGRTVMTIVFTPDENGTVYLSGSQPLEPMTLYPVFEKAK